MCGYANSIGLEVHAGHGLTYETVKPIAAFSELKELNIGHFLISDAIFNGLGTSIKKMKKYIEEARAS
jgi:pyridoxine 5-phosphate synthase